MDKNTLSQYGWVIIVIIVLAIMIGLATPFGNFVKESVMNATDSFGTKIEDSLKFDDSAESDEVITNYTDEEIAANNHLFGIGAKSPNYVVAAFNDDFSKVIITKNGEDSDGLMMSWSAETVEQLNTPMYLNASTLKTAVVENGVTNIGDYAFALCTMLETISLPDSLVAINQVAFGMCSSLDDVVIPDGVTDIGYSAFQLCSSLTNLSLSKNLTTIGSFAFGHCTSLSDITIPSSVTTIKSDAFHNTAMTSVTIPENVTTIETDAFGYISVGEENICTKLDDFTIYGKSGSAAETYANSKNFTFVAI